MVDLMTYINLYNHDVDINIYIYICNICASGNVGDTADASEVLAKPRNQ